MGISPTSVGHSDALTLALPLLPAGAWRLHIPLGRRDAVLGRLRSLPDVRLAEAIEGDRP